MARPFVIGTWLSAPGSGTRLLVMVQVAISKTATSVSVIDYLLVCYMVEAIPARRQPRAAASPAVHAAVASVAAASAGGEVWRSNQETRPPGKSTGIECARVLPHE